jgi:hypothetical protein
MGCGVMLGMGVIDGVSVGVAVSVAVGVAVAVGVMVGVAVCVAVFVAVAVMVADGVSVSVAVGVGVGCAIALQPARPINSSIVMITVKDGDVFISLCSVSVFYLPDSVLPGQDCFVRDKHIIIGAHPTDCVWRRVYEQPVIGYAAINNESL